MLIKFEILKLSDNYIIILPGLVLAGNSQCGTETGQETNQIIY